MLYYTYYYAPIGRLLLECDGTALTGLWIENQQYYAASATSEMHIDDNRPIFITVRQWLDEYFAGRNPDVKNIPLNPCDTDFRRRVWNELQNIPYGKTTTYGDIARKLNTSPRAVGGAVAHNPISIIIPCHRVIGANNSLTGYAGGLDIKSILLSMEHADI